jgi:hypothetical protein
LLVVSAAASQAAAKRPAGVRRARSRAASRASRLLAICLLLLPLVGAAKEVMRTIDWLELMPEKERIALEALASSIDHDGAEPAFDFNSANTVPEMDGATGRIAGFVVPIAHDSKGRITELFLVPYFGACYHVPPPPPNQIIYAKPAQPLSPGDFWDPLWAVGTLNVARTSNDMADAAYRLELDRVEAIDPSEFEGTE